MRDLDIKYSYKHLYNELSYNNKENSLNHGIENVSIIIVNKKRLKNGKKQNVLIHAQQPRVTSRLSRLSEFKELGTITSHSSTPELSNSAKPLQPRNKISRENDTTQKHKQSSFQPKFIVNVVSEHWSDKCLNPFNYPRQTKFKIYRCQVGSALDNCCCTCNSDAMFEVMRSLYECYKKRNCENCNCILCGHLTREEKASLGFSEKEKLLRSQAMKGLPLPEGKTESETKLIIKVRTDLGVPIEPQTKAIRDKHEEAATAGKLLPLDGKTHAEKKKILRELHDLGIPLPVGRTPSEKSLIVKIMGVTPSVAPSEQMRRAKKEGLLTPLKGKTAEQKENILKGLAMKGLPLPEGQTPSEKKLIDKVRADLALPIEPKTKSIREKHDKAAKTGLLKPLEGKTPAEKEKTLKGLHDMGIPLPEGRTPSEKSLIAKVKASSREPSVSLAASEKNRGAKAEGLLSVMKGKTPEEKEKLLKGLAKKGSPLPEGQSSSEKKLINKVRADLGLPVEPKNETIRDKHQEAAKAGLLQPLEGKTPAQKEKILKGQHDLGIPLPEGRTPSEKALIGNVKASARASSAVALSEKMRKAKTEGLLTPLEGKTPIQKEKLLKGLAMKGSPLPEGKTPSEKKLIDKVRTDLGLPSEPKTKSIRERYKKAAQDGFLQPLEGKTPAEKEKILKGLHDIRIPLPEGRTPSEKALISKVEASPRESSTALTYSEEMLRAKASGLLRLIRGETPKEKEKILRKMANRGISLPEGQSPSEKKLINKVRADLGLPIEPKNKAIRDKHEQASLAGLLFPLEGKTSAQKEKLLRGQHNMGIPLPEGRTPSEKALVAKVKGSSHAPSTLALSEKIQKAKAEGLLTPLKGKTPKQKEKILKALAMKGIPLPESQSPSEKKLIDKVRADLGLPIEPKNKATRDRYKQAAKAGFLKPLEGKTPAEKEKILKGLHDMGITLPEGRTPSEKAIVDEVKASPREPSAALAASNQMRRAKAEGLLTPLKGKTAEQREKILRKLANQGIPLREGQSPSEKRLIYKVRADLGLPIEPKNKAIRDRHEQAALAGLLFPLEGKTPAQKEKLLRGQHNMGIPLPDGRTPSEKALIAKIMASSRPPSKATSKILSSSEKMGRTKAEGLQTHFTGKTPEERNKILKELAMKGLPLPEGKTPSEKKLIDKVRVDLGLPTEPKTKSIRDKHEEAARAGLLQPLEGKTPAEKAKILKGLHQMGILLPEGRTPSEKALITKVTAPSRGPSGEALSEKMRKAKAEGLLTPLTGKTSEQKEKILKELAMKGIPFPQSKTPSEKKLSDKIRAELGLPKEPKTKDIRDKHKRAARAGFLQPLEGKTPAEKEKILKGLHDMGIPLPDGRTPLEKALIAKVKTSPRATSLEALSEKMRKAKEDGLLRLIRGETPEEREKLLRKMANRGISLPEGQSPSEKKLISKVRADLGLPIEPKNKAIRDKHEQASLAGLLFPLEGKTPTQKEKLLRGQHNMGIPLPEGRTPSEKSLIAKVKASPRTPSAEALAKKKQRAKSEGLLIPLEGKSPEEKEKILKGLALKGLPLPEGQSPSVKKIIEKVRADIGLPIEPKNKAIRYKHKQAAKAGFLQPLEGKTPAEKEKILKGLHDMGIPLPEGRTSSETALIAKFKTLPREPSAALAASDQMRRAKAEGLLTPLKGKTAEEREKILRKLANRGIPLPEGQSPSEKKLIEKVRADLGLPTEPKTKAIRNKHEQAALAGLLFPLEGKTPAQKEKLLRGQHNMGIPLPKGRTSSEKALIDKILASSRPPSKVASKILSPSEQMRRAKAEGLLTPLTGKTPEQRQKILKELAIKGLPLPEGKTPSEKKLINKVRADLGLPTEPITKSIRDKHEEAARAGLLQPLEGKTPAEKAKILKGLHQKGIPLPEGRTPSEKALIAKVKTSPSATSLEALSEKMRKAKAEGLLTSLTGKTPKQKEKILKELAMKGIPFPQSKTPSEKKLSDKIRADLGLPKEPKTKDIRDRYKKAARAGLLQPLEGKTPAEKEKILKGLHNIGIPLPEGRTPSEKSLIAKLEASPHETSAALTASEEMLRAKASGLLRLIRGETPEAREKILRKMANRGISLPEGQSPSEKKLINKVRADLGLPIEPKNKAIRDKHEQASLAGLLFPLEGKTTTQKEKLLRGQHNMGIPLPEGRTSSEKSLIAKILAGSKIKPARVPGSKKRTAGIDAEEFEDIAKTTTCDRGCGCDKKKIRFKHSYVKIRVTSPDISSFCDCSGECIPGVKSGVFVDSEGIKVTVARAIGIPLFLGKSSKRVTLEETLSKSNHGYTHSIIKKGPKDVKKTRCKVSSFESFSCSNEVNYTQNSTFFKSTSNSSHVESLSARPNKTEPENIYPQSSTPPYEGETNKSGSNVASLACFQSPNDICRNLTSKTKFVSSSLDSILVIKSETSLCSTSTMKSMDTISLTSVVKSATSNSTHFSGYQSSDDSVSSIPLDGPTTSDDLADHSASIGKRKKLSNMREVIPQRVYTVMRMSQTKLNLRNKNLKTDKLDSKTERPLSNQLASKLDVSKIIDKIITNKRFTGASSIFIVVVV